MEISQENSFRLLASLIERMVTSGTARPLVLPGNNAGSGSGGSSLRVGYIHCSLPGQITCLYACLGFGILVGVGLLTQCPAGLRLSDSPGSCLGSLL